MMTRDGRPAPRVGEGGVPMQTRCLGGFSVMWVTKLLLSPVKIRIFCPRMTKFGLKLAFLFILGQALPAHLVPCWWVGWWLWRAGFIVQDTYLLYFSISLMHTLKVLYFCFIRETDLFGEDFLSLMK